MKKIKEHFISKYLLPFPRLLDHYGNHNQQ
jgi:hypothetical protein